MSQLLITIANEEYLPHSHQLFSSAVIRGQWCGDLLLVTDCRKPEKLKTFIENGVKVYVTKFNTDEWTKSHCKIPYEKFKIFKSYYKRWANIVYLDSDIIVNGDISILGYVHGFWASCDYLNSFADQFYEVQSFSEKNLRKRRSFNAGVLAFSTDVISTKTYDDLIALAEKHASNSRYSDQPIFNMYFYERWNKLPQSYNFFVEYMKSTLFINSRTAKIWHFPNDRKPWEYDSRYHSVYKYYVNKNDFIKMKRNNVGVNLIGRIFFFCEYVNSLSYVSACLVARYFKNIFNKRA